MALHRKARRIVVDGWTYRWVIRPKAPYGARMQVVVEDVATGSITRFRFEGHRDEVVVTPKDVARLIRKAVRTGWPSHRSGSAT
ncbi:MAG: hypothetical protein AAGE52_15780 [Myxococcota bacterium]